MNQKTVLFFCIVAFLLLGCNQENELTLYSDQEWKYESHLTYDPDAMPDIGISAPIFAGLSLDASTNVMNPALVEASLEQAVNLYRRYGYDVDWQKRRSWGGEVTYTIVAQGRGWDRLEALLTARDFAQELDAAFTPAQSIQIREMADGQIHFIWQLPPDELGLGYLFPIKTQLHGGRIIQSNADQVRGGTAIWSRSAGRLEATLTPASRINSAVVMAAGGVAAIVVLGGGGYLLSQIWRPRRRPPGRPGGGGSGGFRSPPNRPGRKRPSPPPFPRR